MKTERQCQNCFFLFEKHAIISKVGNDNMEKLILIKYGELTTKKGNRKTFIRSLKNRIEKVLKKYPIQIRDLYDRMYIEVDNQYLNQCIEALQKVFGIFGIVICYKVNTNIDDIQEKTLDILKDRSFKTFKVETKRSYKQFPISSMELSRKLGGHILKNFNVKVDVHQPDLVFHVEIHKDYTYLYENEIRGLGGYPVGIQGKGLLMLSGGIDSPVAGYLALKRGVDLECLYFESPPHTSVEAKNKVLELARIIDEYSGNIKVHIVPFTKLQEAIYKNVPDHYVITIMRRMMYRIAEEVCKRHHLKVMINGESIGQVASQTLSSMQVINSVTNLPVIRPVACMDKLEIIAIAKKIGTYETSILPYEDCCTIFLPKHPVINPDLESCLTFEKNFDYQSLIEDFIEHIETIKNLERETYSDLL